MQKLNSLSINIATKIKHLFKNKCFIACLITVFIVGIAAHGFVMSNLFLNHDSLNEFYTDSAYFVWKIRIGRYFAPFYSKFSGTIVTYPWSNTLISFVWIAIASFVLCVIFDVNEAYKAVLISMLLVVNRTVTATLATFTSEIGSYMFAMMLATIAAYYWNKKSNLINFSVSVLLLVVSVGIYQSYFSVFVIVVMIKTIRDLSEDKEYKIIFTNIFKGIIISFLAIALYYIGYKLVLLITNLSPNEGEYNSISNAFGLFEVLKTNIFSIYKVGIREIAWPSNTAHNIFAYNVACLILVFVSVISNIIKTKKPINVTLIVLICLLFPLFCNFTNILSGEKHDLMYFSCYIVLSMAILTDANNEFSFKGLILCVLVSFITLSNIQTANAVYVKKEIQARSTYFYVTDIIEKLEDYPEYEKYLSKIAIVGQYYDDFQNDAWNDINMHATDQIFGITYYSTWKSYFKTVLNYPINLVSETEKNELAKTEDVANMGVFPMDGSIKKIGDTIVIKVSW